MDVPKVANNLRITAELHQGFKAKLYIFSVYIYKKRFKAILNVLQLLKIITIIIIIKHKKDSCLLTASYTSQIEIYNIR